MKRRSKVLLIILAAVVVGIFVVVNFMQGGRNLTKVYAEAVMVKELTEEVSASGYIQPENSVNITAQVSAEIKAVFVKDGQTVSRGQILVQLDTVQLKKNVEQYEYSLNEMKARTEASKSQYLQAEEEYERQKELFERELTSETAYDNAKYTFENYKFSYEAMLNQTKQAKARYEQGMDNLSKTTIVAPMSGVITFLDCEVGEIAAAQTPYSMGRTLMTISNLSAFEVEVDVDETEITKIELGQKANIEVDAFPDTIFSGEVVEIGNTAVVSMRSTNEQATNFKVKVLFLEENPDIRPGMSATVDIITCYKEDVLAVPYGAVVMRTIDLDSLERVESGDTLELAVADSNSNHNSNNSESENSENSDSLADEGEKNEKELKGVFVAHQGKARFIPVETGIADQRDIEVVSGLSREDTVISGPYRILRSIENDEEIEIIPNPSTGNI
jgi:HlyD family secretion protein